MPSSPDDVLAAHHVLVQSDNRFQRKARLLQALWREEQGLPIGEHRGQPLGSRLAMPRAEERLENYLTETIRGVVQSEVIDPRGRADKLYDRPRIFNDLLSSQPLCFNLFAELQQNLALASRVFQRRWERISEVTSVQFEHSPGRSDPRFTGDRSAFDVFVSFVDDRGRAGFVGIEVKYHEDLGDAPAEHRDRYDDLADAMREFLPSERAKLRAKPLQQIWRDHLLAGSLVLANAGFAHGGFVFLYPRDNSACAKAIRRYGECLTGENTFAAWTLEDLVADVVEAGAGSWIGSFRDRYLDFQKIERAHPST